MKKLGDVLLQRESFSEIVMGNTAIVRAMVEAGTRVVTSYPGSPTPEIAGAIGSIDSAVRPFHFEFCTNEKVATEVAYGAAVNGRPSVVFFKSVGLNVAADTFVQLNHMDIPGGMVVVIGDDPGAHSSQNEQDNRHIARMSYTPVFEPGSATEVYQYFLAAASIARKLRMAVLLRLTTHVCHGKEMVSFGALDKTSFDDTPLFNGAGGKYIPIGPMVAVMKKRALERLDLFNGSVRELGLNRVVSFGNNKRGIITAGLPFYSVLDVVSSVEEKPDILKLAAVYPLDESAVIEFLKSHSEVLVLEELDDFMEQIVKRIAFDNKIDVSIKGKEINENWIGEYTPNRVRSILHQIWPELVAASPFMADSSVVVPVRTPQMCPGCGHRSAFHAIGKVLKESDITVADIGCHTLGFLPPYEIGKLLMSMGASTGIAQGLSLFNSSRRVVCFLGDSTFFHAGLPGIVNAIFNNHSLTLIVMDNGTTAMTGHQDHPGTGKNFNGGTDKIPVKGVLEGLGVKDIVTVDTYNQKALAAAVAGAMDAPGFSVVIAKHPCMLKFMREQKRKPDFKATHVEVKEESCTLARECIDDFACPSFKWEADKKKVVVNKDLCIGDGSCIQTCPSKAIARDGGKGDSK